MRTLQGYWGERRDSLHLVNPLRAPKTAKSTLNPQYKHRAEGPLLTTQQCFPAWLLISFSPRLRNWEAHPHTPSSGVHAVAGGGDMTV